MRGSWRSYAVPAAVAVVGTALSVFVYRWVDQFQDQRISSEFRHRTQNIARVLSSGVDDYANFLQSYANQTALFNRQLRSADPTELLRIRDEWESSKPSIHQTIEDARAHYPGIRAIGWATRVGREHVAQYEQVARLLVSPDYRLRELGEDNVFRPLSDRAEYVPVFYAEPPEDAAMLLGVDLSHSNKLGEALEVAAERGEVTASEPIRMIREITGQLGIFVVSPIYYGGRPELPEERADAVATYLFAVVLVENLLTTALAGLDEPGIVFFVYPGPEDLSPRSLTAQPVYASNGDPASIEFFRDDPHLTEQVWRGSIGVAGRNWDLYAFPTHEFIAAYDTWTPEIVLLFSCLFSIAVAAFLGVFIGRAERISRIVAERTRDLELVNKALESEIDMRRTAESQKRGLESQLYQAQRMDSIGNLAGGIAHDFNNILLAVLGYIDLSRTIEGLPPKAVKYLDSAKAAGDRAVTLTRQLLAFGRRQALAVAPRDLNEVVRGFENILDRIVPESITFAFRPADGTCVVMGDAGQLEQVVMNLVVNACESMPDGGALTVSTARLELTENDVAARPNAAPGQYVVLSVKDTGTGISDAELDRIFEPFYTTKEHRQGTGLGLAVVYGIVEQHGGFIEAQSKPGEGSEFRVYLPLSQEQAATQRPRAAVEPEGGSETVLVVEDEFEVRDFARTVLESAGYRVILAENGRRGLELFNEHRDEISVVFADVVMPEMGGRDLSNAIHRIEPRMPVILTSGYLGGEEEEYFLGDDVNFIAKPYSPSDLRSEVRRVLGRRTAALG